MEGISIKGLPSCWKMPCLLLAVFTVSLWWYVPWLASDRSLTKTTYQMFVFEVSIFFLSQLQLQSLYIKHPAVLLSFKSKSCIVINNAVPKGSFFFKGQGKLLLIIAKGQFSQIHTNRFLTHPAFNFDRNYVLIMSTLHEQGVPKEILPI